MANESTIIVKLVTGDNAQTINNLSAANENEKANPVGTFAKSLLGAKLSSADKENTGALASSKMVSTIANKTLGVAKSVASYNLNKKYTLTEDYLAQQDYQNTMNTINGVASMATSVISSAAAFGMINPVLAPLGAVVGLGSSVIDNMINYQMKMDQLQIQLATTHQVSDFHMARLGLVNEGRGTEN